MPLAFTSTSLPRLSHVVRHPQPMCSAAASSTKPPTPPPTPPATPLRTPTHRRIPVIGFILDQAFDRLDAPALARKYGPVYHSDILGFPLTVIADLVAITALSKDPSTFRSLAFPPFIAKLFGQSTVLFYDGPVHAAKRAAIAPALASVVFPLYFPPLLASARALWAEVSASAPTTLRDHVKDHNLRVIAMVVTGLPGTDPRFARVRPLFIRFARGISTLPFGTVWNDALAAREDLLAIFNDLIRDRLVERAQLIEELRSFGDDLSDRAAREVRQGRLDVLTVAIAASPLPLEQGAPLDPVVMLELAETAVMLFFGGYFTQTSSLLSSVMELGFDQKVHSRLVEEQERLIAAADGDREVLYEDVLRRMPLLDSFITEVMRLRPPATSVLRRAAKETMVCGHRIEEGEVVQLDFWAANRDAKYFENPTVLAMDRFLQGKDSQPQRPITFGAPGGAHFCLGAGLAKINLKTALSVLLREYDPVLDPSQTRKFTAVPEMEPKEGVRVSRCEGRVVGKEE